LSPTLRRASLAALGLAGLALVADPTDADVRLQVGSGRVDVTEDHLDVVVELSNAGGTSSGPVDVDGEIFGSHSLASVPAGIPAGEMRPVSLRFDLEAARPGTHALSLLLDYAAVGASQARLSQRAYLLIALGEAPPSALGVEIAPDARLDWYGEVTVVLRSADSRPHEARLRLEGPRGLRVLDPEGPISVPAQGAVHVPIRVFRGTLPWTTAQGVLAVAVADDGPAVRTTVAAGTVTVGPDPAWSPRLRKPVLLLALLLLGVAAFVEAWRRLA
jgi:hypothetical protein